jgi:MioC protein
MLHVNPRTLMDNTPQPTPNICILVGTMTENATTVAEEIVHAFNGKGAQIALQMMDFAEPAVFEQDAIFLVVTSTYGQGDVPDNAKPFYDELCAKRPNLGRVRYGVFGLGDRTYAQTFNNGGKRFDDILAELGATRIGERAKHDASSGELPEDVALEWFAQWLPLCCKSLLETAPS